jgi:hypothetical protein
VTTIYKFHLLNSPLLTLMHFLVIYFIDPKARMTVKEISKHSWFQPGLAKGAMIINNMHAMESRQSPPSDEEVNLIKSIIKEAQTTVGPASGGGSGIVKLVSVDMESLLSESYD